MRCRLARWQPRSPAVWMCGHVDMRRAQEALCASHAGGCLNTREAQLRHHAQVLASQPALPRAAARLFHVHGSQRICLPACLAMHKRLFFPPAGLQRICLPARHAARTRLFFPPAGPIAHLPPSPPRNAQAPVFPTCRAYSASASQPASPCTSACLSHLQGLQRICLPARHAMRMRLSFPPAGPVAHLPPSLPRHAQAPAFPTCRAYSASASQPATPRARPTTHPPSSRAVGRPRRAAHTGSRSKARCSAHPSAPPRQPAIPPQTWRGCRAAAPPRQQAAAPAHQAVAFRPPPRLAPVAAALAAQAHA
eukprot:365446-Chlamydomonas_euryale.AAC.2